MGIYRCFILDSDEILREFQSVKNQASINAFLCMSVLPARATHDRGLLRVAVGTCKYMNKSSTLQITGSHCPDFLVRAAFCAGAGRISVELEDGEEGFLRHLD